MTDIRYNYLHYLHIAVDLRIIRDQKNYDLQFLPNCVWRRKRVIPRFRESESNFEAKWRTKRAFFGKSVIQCVERESH